MTPSHLTGSEPAVCIDDISVRFGDFTAVDRVSVEWAAGGIHAIVGQNGAGKSTLAKVIAGLQPSAGGRMTIKGRSINSGDHVGARRAGIDMVHQHSSLVPTMTVAEALETTDGGSGRSWFRWGGLVEKWEGRLAESGVSVDVRARVGDLSVEAIQSLEIARANPGSGGILILDEPTAVLPPAGVEALFGLLRDLRGQAITILIVLHKIGEVREIADTVTVLRRGQCVLPPTPMTEVTNTELSEAIIGTSLSGPAPDREPRFPETDSHAPAALSLSECSTPGTAHEIALDDVTITVERGELVGVAGVDGNGQRGIVELLCGVGRPSSGSVTHDGTDISALDVRARRDRGLHVVPFDRFAEGVSGDEPLWRNVALWDGERHRIVPWLPFVSVKAMRRRAVERLDEFGVEYQDVDQPAKTLSGGNAQRLILSREFEGVSALVIAQPTRGLDIGGIDFVWRSVHQLVDEGLPVLAVSSDLDELINNCDRLYVMRGGRVALECRAPFDLAEIGDAMTGGVRA